MRSARPTRRPKAARVRRGGSFVLVLGLVLLPCTYSNALERATWPNLPRLQQTIPAAAPAAPIRPKNLSPNLSLQKNPSRSQRQSHPRQVIPWLSQEM